MDMKTIDSAGELDELLSASNERPLLIFKHSNACPISARAHREMRALVEGGDAPAYDFGMIVVQAARDLSSEIEERLGVRHETPQAIVVRDGRAVWDASHFDVTRDKVVAALEGS
jgi:bacillithiol system protein YtxJ